MRRFHRARIHWSSEQLSRALRTITRNVDPARFMGVRPGAEDAWSFVCEFDVSPPLQGTPSSARIRFYVDEAPHDRLRPWGHALPLREGNTAECDVRDTRPEFSTRRIMRRCRGRHSQAQLVSA